MRENPNTLERPHCRVVYEEGFIALPESEWERLRTEFMAGKAFYECSDAWGDPVVVKLGRATTVTHRTAGGLEILEAEEEERERRKLVGGTDA